MGKVKLKDSLGCSDHELVAFETLTAVRRAHRKLPILDFRKADLGVFRDFLGKIPGNKSLKERDAPESCLILQNRCPISGAMYPNKEEVRKNH